MNKKDCLFLPLLLLSFQTISAVPLSYDNTPPSSPVTEVQTLDGPVMAVLYQTTEEAAPNLFKRGDNYLQIIESNDSWWIQTPPHFDMMRLLEFIDDSQLMLELLNPAASATVILDIESREVRSLESGQGHYIRSGINQGLVEMQGQKSYVTGEGAFWYSSLVDLDGNPVEILSVSAEFADCLTVRQILGAESQPPALRQALDDCIGE